MNPHQKNKIDLSLYQSMSADEQRLFRLYGKLPNKKDLLQNKLKERKYFDSGDYALSKAGKASDTGVTTIGREHPNPETIPHLSPSVSHERSGSISSASGIGIAPVFSQSGGGVPTSSSPVKESSFLNRETSIDDQGEDDEDDTVVGGGVGSPPAMREGMAIRGAR